MHQIILILYCPTCTDRSKFKAHVQIYFSVTSMSRPNSLNMNKQ